MWDRGSVNGNGGLSPPALTQAARSETLGGSSHKNDSKLSVVSVRWFKALLLPERLWKWWLILEEDSLCSREPAWEIRNDRKCPEAQGLYKGQWSWRQIVQEYDENLSELTWDQSYGGLQNWTLAFPFILINCATSSWSMHFEICHPFDQFFWKIIRIWW